MTNDYQIRVLPNIAYSAATVKEYIAREKGIDARTIKGLRILKRSIDARHNPVYVNLTVRIFVNEEPPATEYVVTHYPDVSSGERVIVVGEGPGGLFAALRPVSYTHLTLPTKA